MEKILVVDSVSFRYGSFVVLSKISFVIRKGDFVGLIGPNGSGKTTLLNLILRLHPLQSGKIKIAGKDISTFSEWHKVGYVPQKVTHFSDTFPASVREIVLTGLLSKKRFPKRYDSRDQESALDSLRKVGMESFLERKIGALSGGQQQRVLIARALIANPLLLILDEPTTGIDQSAQQKFYDLLGDLNKESITIILVSHDLGKITNYVNRVASLNRTLEFYGSHEEFCRHPSADTDHHCLKLKVG